MTREIDFDTVASVQYPGKVYPMSRLLIDTDNNAAVFVVGTNAPVLTFTSTQRNRMRGMGVGPEGQTIRWNRRGSSCQYQLATCKVNTDQLQSRWAD